MSSDNDSVGYGRPPKQAQFKKGQSGNPSGRPRGSGSKAQAKSAALPKLFPTRDLLRAEAARPVMIRDGDDRYEIPTTEGVMRALAKSAMQGGVLAARTYLQYQMAEDERIHAKKKKSFGYWSEYVIRMRGEIAKAVANGWPIPDEVPHPDDIEFNYLTLEVTFTGPIDDEEVPEFARRQARFQTALELMSFYREYKHPEPTEAEPVFGAYRLLAVLEGMYLPQRMRHLSDEFFKAMEGRIWGGRYSWENYLEARCAELEIAFIPGMKRSAIFNLRQIGHSYVNGRIVPYDWKRMRPVESE
jgi:hypothetical protein